MCMGKGCKKKKTCYRFVAQPSTYQSYFSKPPAVKGKCDYYWELKEPERKKNKKKVKE